MNKLFVSTLLVLIAASSSFSQQQKKVLLTIDEIPIYDTEFKRVYKKNLELVQNESQKDIDGYLELFINNLRIDIYYFIAYYIY